ncbi:MAG: DUF4350 domain-containing protein [Haloarculaceae archaeon]
MAPLDRALEVVRDRDYPRALLATFATVVLVVLVVGASVSTASFGPFNARWNGASALQEQADLVGARTDVVRDTGAYAGTGEGPSPNATVAVVLSPSEPYAESEAADLRRFVRRGGTLVVAEDFREHSNGLLAAVGARARVDGALLRDKQFNWRASTLPVVTNVSNHSLVANVSELTLNRGTAVRPDGATVLVSSSEFAFRDVNDNGDLDDDEELGTYPVATVESVGGGRVVVVGDPSIAINTMLEREGNRAFVQSLLDGHERVVLDYSHAADFPPLALAVLLLRDSALLQLVVGLGAILAVATWVRDPDWRQLADRLGRGRRGERTSAAPPSETAMVEYIADQHPTWDRERIERVVRAVRERRRK